MINEERLLKTFLRLAKIDSPSLKEGAYAQEVIKILTDRGIKAFEDDTKNKVSGQCGNIICHIPSTGETGGSPGIMFSAHMDTVEPCMGKKIIVDENDGVIRTDGETVLGADDSAGVSAIIEAFISLKEMGAPHGDLWGIFTVGEEIGLFGSKSIDLDKYGINANYGYVLDAGGAIGTCCVQGPTQNIMKLRFRGKSAHAGIEPEKGVNAIVLASDTVVSIPQGRIDEETTCNVGVISGGKATNIVPDTAILDIEVRSLSEKKLEEITHDILMKAETVCKRRGGSVSMESNNAYPAYCVSPDSSVIKDFSRACSHIGIKPVYTKTGGGSDTNFYNKKGIPTVNVSVGMDKVHTTQECIKISDLNRVCALVHELCWK